LHHSLIDSSFSQNNFEFKIAGTTFSSLNFLVDGIYPPLSHLWGLLVCQLGLTSASLQHGRSFKGKTWNTFLVY
jgi:hypothetical protein